MDGGVPELMGRGCCSTRGIGAWVGAGGDIRRDKNSPRNRAHGTAVLRFLLTKDIPAPQRNAPPALLSQEILGTLIEEGEGTMNPFGKHSYLKRRES